MADSSVVIRLKAVDDGAIAVVNNTSSAFTGLTIASTATDLAFRGLQKASSTSFAQFAVGAESADKLSSAMGKVVSINSKALTTFSALSDITFIGGQVLTAAKGIQDAVQVYSRVPQALELIQSSGVGTKSVTDFYNLTDAIKGSDAAMDQFAVSAVQELGRFEQAAARAGTILRSSVNFDSTGAALRASQKEQIDNAFQVQKIVNSQLSNTVTSTEALTGQYEVLSSGFTKAADSQQVLQAGLKLVGIGQAGGTATDPGETLRLLTKTLNAYQLSAGDAGKASAVLNSIVENGLTTVQELSLGFGQTATSAKAAGIGLTDLAASTATLTTQGVSTSNALTGIQRVAGNIISKTPEAQEALNKLSLNGQKIRFDQAEIQAKGFTQALLDLNKAAGGNTKVLQEIFPEEIAFRTILGLLAQDGQKLAGVLQNTASVSASSLDEVFKIATGDRVNKFQQIVNRFQELIIKVAQSVAPVFEPGLKILEDIANVFNSLPDPVKEAIGAFIAFQITSRATGSAVGVLFQTMLNLAGTYAQVRLVSLALSGDLGKELAIVRDLVVQRKGLLSAAFQLLGVDQRFRLETQATTQALEKQNIVTKAIASTRAKTGEIFSKNFSGFTGESVTNAREQVASSIKKGAAEGVQSAKNTGLGLAEAIGIVATPQILGPDGKPFSKTGIERVKQEAQKTKEAIASSIASVATPKVNTAVEISAAVSAQQSVASATTVATTTIKAQTSATVAHTVALTANELAEKGLARTRIFGKEVLFGTIGPLGAINSLLTTEISLKTVATGAATAFAKAQAIATSSTKTLGVALSTPTLGIGALGKAAGGLAAQGITGLVGALGPIAPLAALAGAAVFAFREDLFGLRKAANDASDGLAEIIAKDKDLSKQFGGERRILEFKAELKADDSTSKVETQLQQLRLSGDLTTGQFNQLRETLYKVGEQGKLTADGLNTFKSQLEAIRQGAQGKVEKGVGDRVGEFFTGIPGAIASGGDYLLNIFGAAFSNPLEFFNPLTSGKATRGVERDREADRLIQDLSRIGLAIDTIGDQSISTAQKTRQYRNAQGLTEQANEKIRSGEKLSQDDLDREEQIFKAQRSRNENLIAEIDKNLVAQKKVAESIKDPSLKVDFENRINLLESERSALEKRNEALKAGREELVKYYTETLPALKRALTETTNLQQSLLNAQSTFGQQFKLDAQGNATPFLKDIATLRNEASQYVAQIQEAYQGGVFEKVRQLPGAPENEAVTRLRAVRDNQITLPDGTKGFRLAVSDRIAATQQVVELENAGSKSRIAAINLEIENNKLAQQQRVKSSEATESAIAQLQIKSIKESLAQKEQEIKEYAQFPVKKTQLEAEASALRVQVQQQEASAQARTLERQRAARQEVFDIEIEQVRALQSERVISAESAERRITQLQINAAKDRLNNLITDYNKSGKSSVELEQKIAVARAQLRQQEASEQARLLEKQRATRQESFNIEAEQIKALQAERVIGTELAEKQIAQIQINAAKDRLGNLVADYNKSGKSSVELQQKIAVANAQLRQQEASEQVRLLEKERAARQESFNVEVEQIKALQAERIIGAESAERQIAQLQIKGTKDRLNNLVADYNKSGNTSVELEQKIAITRAQLRQQEAAERSRLLEKQRAIQQEAFNIEVERIKALQSERAISTQSAEREIAQTQINAARDRLRDLTIDYERSSKTSVELEQKIVIARAQLRQQESAEIERLFNLEQERQKKILANSTQIQALILQRRASALEGQGKDLEGQSSLLSSFSQLRNIQSDSVIASFETQLKFTGDVEKRAKIETEIAETKARSLVITQQQERISLATQAQVSRIQSEREQIQLRIQQIESQRQAAELRLELVKAQRERRTPEEIQSIQLQIQSATQQGNILAEQSQRLERSRIQQEQIAENSRQELEIKQRIATTNADIEVRLARQKEIQASIEKIARGIEVSAQVAQLAGQIRINQGEALLKVYDQQRDVISATQESLKGRIDFVSGELQLAQELTKSDARKKEIAQTIAAIKLRSLNEQLAMETRVLDLNQAQKAAQLEQEKIRNRVSQSQNLADIAKAQADLAKAKADPTSSPESIQAAQLGVQSKIEEGISLKFAENLLEQQGKTQNAIGRIERQNLQQRSQLQRDQTQYEFAQTLPRREQREIFENLRANALSSVLPIEDTRLAMNAFVRQVTESLRNQPTPLEPDQRQYAQQVSRVIQREPITQVQSPDFEKFRQDQLSRFKEFEYQAPIPKAPTNEINIQPLIGAINKLAILDRPPLQVQFPDFEKFRQDQLSRFKEFGYQTPIPKISVEELNTQPLMNAIDKLTQIMSQKQNQQSVSVEKLEVPITNNFSTQDGRVADGVARQIRNYLYNLGRELGR